MSSDQMVPPDADLHHSPISKRSSVSSTCPTVLEFSHSWLSLHSSPAQTGQLSLINSDHRNYEPAQEYSHHHPRPALGPSGTLSFAHNNIVFSQHYDTDTRISHDITSDNNHDRVGSSTMSSSLPHTIPFGKSTVAKKRKRCLKCRGSRGNRKCSHYPATLTRQLAYEAQDTFRERTSQQHTFWDLTELFELCEQLRGGTGACSDWTQLWTSFCDRRYSKNYLVHTINVFPFPQRLNCAPVNDNGLKEPCLLFEQLNRFVATSVWGIDLWNANKVTRTFSESLFWSMIQLFTGYFSLMHHLRTTIFEHSAFDDIVMLQGLAVEYIYSLGWQMQMYYGVIMWWCQHLVHPEDLEIKPATVLYGLEVLHLLLKSMQETDWKIQHRSPTDPLLRLQHYLNISATEAINHVQRLHLQLSSTYRQRQMKLLPKIIKFARDQEQRRFPRHCTINTTSVIEDTLHLPTFETTVIDLLKSSSSHDTNTIATTKAFEDMGMSYITEDNSIMNGNYWNDAQLSIASIYPKPPESDTTCEEWGKGCDLSPCGAREWVESLLQKLR